MRPELDNEMKKLHDMLLKMGALIEESISNTILALKNQDIDLARQVIAKDDEIDQLEEDIQKECINIIALQSPIASDLREITAVLKMITDLERIGDHCEDICEYTIKLAGETYIKPLIHIPQMAEKVSEMVNLTIECYINRDKDTAIRVAKMDDDVDNYFYEIVEELQDIMETTCEEIPQCVNFIFIVKYLERMADHATNICEWVVYNITGSKKSLD